MHATLDIPPSLLQLKHGGVRDFDLVYSLDQELAAYGSLANTGDKIEVVVDMDLQPAWGLRIGSKIGRILHDWCCGVECSGVQEGLRIVIQGARFLSTVAGERRWHVL
ncbi:unnamed protein product [Tuber aestivum]|uniref:Uncharacterized protein n=1 Tax=Tuber aestivum TaxID=59557 RepID=A0A292PWW4_9PEZI|nr:unnamed protein product [Tuber aestivum]